MISKQIREGLGRLSIYQDRVKEDLARGNYAQAMADMAELHYIAEHLWELFQQETNKSTLAKEISKGTGAE
jgi:hypothetical protein